MQFSSVIGKEMRYLREGTKEEGREGGREGGQEEGREEGREGGREDHVPVTPKFLVFPRGQRRRMRRERPSSSRYTPSVPRQRMDSPHRVWH